MDLQLHLARPAFYGQTIEIPSNFVTVSIAAAADLRD